MAISPEQLRDTFKQDIIEFEKKIDQILVSQGDLTFKNHVSMTIPREMKHDHFEVLRLRYIGVGWKDVIWRSDQREGDWLEFVYK